MPPISPDMIREDIRAGKEYEAKKEYYRAYWIYMYAESAVEREDEATCLIGSKKEFGKATWEAGNCRLKVLEYLTDDEKEMARNGVNPFVGLDWPKELPSSFQPYDLEGYHMEFVSDLEDVPKDLSTHRATLKGGCLLIVVSCVGMVYSWIHKLLSIMGLSRKAF